MSEPTLTTLCRRRGVVRASVTRLTTRLSELESKVHEPSTAQRMSQRLESLDSDFKIHHYAVVDALREEHDDGAAAEQDVLDKHDDDIASLIARIEQLIVSCSSVAESGARSVAAHRLSQLKTTQPVLQSPLSLRIQEGKSIWSMSTRNNSPISRRNSGIFDSTSPRSACRKSWNLNATISAIDKELFDLSLIIKRLLYNPETSEAAPSHENRGVRLPKLDVPTFNGDIIRCPIHNRTDISDTEKLVYLRHVIKDGTVAEGLSRSGEHYAEAVEFLKSRHNCPRLIHQTHVRNISGVPNLKGKELRRLHLRALKAMGHEPSGSFITSLLEVKLDPNTMFEWQRFSHDQEDVPYSSNLLDFLNLRAQASETCSPESKFHTPKVNQ